MCFFNFLHSLTYFWRAKHKQYIFLYFYITWAIQTNDVTIFIYDNCRRIRWTRVDSMTRAKIWEAKAVAEASRRSASPTFRRRRRNRPSSASHHATSVSIFILREVSITICPFSSIISIWRPFQRPSTWFSHRFINPISSKYPDLIFLKKILFSSNLQTFERAELRRRVDKTLGVKFS